LKFQYFVLPDQSSENDSLFNFSLAPTSFPSNYIITMFVLGDKLGIRSA